MGVGEFEFRGVAGERAPGISGEWWGSEFTGVFGRADVESARAVRMSSSGRGRRCVVGAWVSGWLGGSFRVGLGFGMGLAAAGGCGDG